HDRRRLLMVHQDEPDPVVVAAEALHDAVDAIAGEPEHGVNAPVDQPFHHQLRRDLAHTDHALFVERRRHASAPAPATPAATATRRAVDGRIWPSSSATSSGRSSLSFFASW